MIIRKTLLYVFLSFFFITYLSSKSLIIENNNRLSFDDLNNLTSFDLTSDITEDNLNMIIKDLISSDLINTVELSSNLENYILIIFESLYINKIYINGNIKLNNSDIDQNLTIKNKSFVDDNKIIYNSNIIENLYSSIGQENVIVSYYLEQFDKNSFNLIYNVKESPEKYVSNISINGNTFLSSKFIKSSINIKEKNFFSPISISNFINENKLNNALSKIEIIYNDNGFFDFEINYEVRSLKNKISLYLIINEGFRYKVQNINFVSDNQIAKSLFSNKNDTIIKSINNKFYNNDTISTISEEFNKELSLSNNSNLSINHSYSFNDDKSVDVNLFTIDQDPITIQKLSFTGNSVTKDSTLRSQVFVKPGELYNKRLIDKSVNNLLRKRYLDNAIANTKLNNDNTLDLEIAVTEKIKSGNFKLGAGYSAQNGIATAIGLSDSNFYGTGNKINADLSLSDNSVYYDLSYQRFFLGNYNIDNTLRVFNSSEDLVESNGYKIKSTGLDLSLKIPYKYDISKDQYFRFSLGYEANDIYALSALSSSSVKQNAGKSNNIYIKNSYISNTMNDNFNPTSGTFHQTTLTLFPSEISDDDHVKIISINNFYFNNKISDNSNFILSKIGVASGLSNKIKTKDSFSLGGDFKGFQYSGIGPRDASLNYLGGTKIYQLTVGRSNPFLFDNSDTFVFKYFGTIGSIFDSEFASTYNSKTPRFAIGASLDVMTAIGPLSFSLASPISKNAEDKTQSYDFSIGSTF
jgi:outer membrane protein insertion porin family